MMVNGLKEGFMSWCVKENLQLGDIKKIQYGTQIVVSDGQDNVSVNFYTTGKTLVQGKSCGLKERLNGWAPQAGKTKKLVKKKEKIQDFGKKIINRIGIDESGKGDYFGPLVIAAAYVEKDQESWLSSIGVQDSKKITDKKILEISSEIEKEIPFEIVALEPEKYNKMYKEIKNLNLLLAWGHARTLESLLEKVEATIAISDQFANKSVLNQALMEKGRQIILIQRHKAEEDLAVAVASILARAKFLGCCKKMNEKYDLSFSKGASSSVESEARIFVEKMGKKQLEKVAKLHFKTTGRVI